MSDMKSKFIDTFKVANLHKETYRGDNYGFFGIYHRMWEENLQMDIVT
jgi:hypothetical protein